MPRHGIIVYMSDVIVSKQFERNRSTLRGERLGQLRFEDAINDCIALSELAMDMVEAFASREELIWIQNGFKPTRKTRLAKPPRQRVRS